MTGTVVEHTFDNRGMMTSRCPACGTQFVYWDDEDLDENGDLRCYCIEEAAHEAEQDERQYRHDKWADETFG